MIFSITSPNSKNRSTRNALAIFLMKMRLDLSQHVLSFLFGIHSQPTVSKIIKSVVTVLEKNFVPKYTGYDHIDRNELLNMHMTRFHQNVLKLDSDRLVLILDGTYFYIQKPTNHDLQRKTFSMHKHRNLLKSMLVVCPDGYILAAEGLYYADGHNNDSSILKNMLQKKDILSKIEKGDGLILDRGFRDVTSNLENMGFKVFMPNLLSKNQKQFSEKEANSSREVTMLRWVTESANGRIKNMYKFFDHTIQV